MFKIKNRILTEYIGNERNISIPENVKIIGADSFAWSGIESVFIPSSVEIIEENAFKRCRELRKITIENGCKAIGGGAFSSCCKLTDIIIPESVSEMGERIFEDCAELVKVSLPDGLHKIESRAFANCASLSEINAPRGLTEIGGYAFNGCRSLSEPPISEKLEAIGDGAFVRCTKIKRLTFPRSLKRIGSDAFAGCFDLEVKFSSAPESVGKTVFPDTRVSIPDGVIDMYSTSFLNRAQYRSCPEIDVYPSVRTLRHGFDKLLGYDEYRDNNTTLRHILYLMKYGCKLFIGEKYYADGYIIRNGETDFSYYDSQFGLASEYERPLIAAYRLSYPVCLSENFREKYTRALIGYEKTAAEFAVERNDRKLLKTVLKMSEFDAATLDLLYDKAHGMKHFGLLNLINRQSVSLDAVFSL